MLTLGIPSNAVMAMMAGGMMIHGIIPGPQVMTDKPGLFWGMIACMWVGNTMLIVFNLPMVGMWVKMLMVPYRLLSIAILFFCCIGVYSLNNSADEVLLIRDLASWAICLSSWAASRHRCCWASFLGR